MFSTGIISKKEKGIKEKERIVALKENIILNIIQTEKEKSKLETSSTQKISDFSKKTLQEKKDLEHRCFKLSKQVSEFEKILITERDTFAKERQVLEAKITELLTQISTLQDLLEKERKCFKENKRSYELEKKNAEKRNTGIFKDISEKTKNLEKDFEQERLHFESEISKLQSKITVISSDILKEQKVRSDLKHKFDTLNSERNILAAMIKDLEVANVNLSEKITADVISQSPVANSTESVCSFKTVSSSIHDKNVLKNKSVKPIIVKSSQIRPSNLFYDKSVDGSVSYYEKSLGKQSKKNQMVWRVKDSSEERKKDKASASTTNANKNSVHKGLLKGKSVVLTVERMISSNKNLLITGTDLTELLLRYHRRFKKILKKDISKTNGEDNPEEIILKVQDNSDAYYVSETDSEDDSRKFVFLKTDQRLQR
ncbi:hypothetical protein L6452_21825 [Arctium lappa]|uniref:Uncharacterized protein n=1 Tax=Arctium lappa TaxID=4217 RepID=A0ACB9B2G2_ARCLA|nr:hypothetical protein L6452_21825 [Arctium lappa]